MVYDVDDAYDKLNEMGMVSMDHWAWIILSLSTHGVYWRLDIIYQICDLVTI